MMDTSKKGVACRECFITSYTLWFLFLCLFQKTVSVTDEPESCPPADKVQPCTCDVTLEGLFVMCKRRETNQIWKVTEKMREIPRKVFSMKIQDSNLPKVPDFIFLGMMIESLTITNSKTAVIEDNALSGLGDQMEYFDLSNNYFKTIPTAGLKNLHVITFLSLANNDIKYVPENSFQNLHKLERLYLPGNNIMNFSEHAFQGLERKLVHLDLSNNMISKIPNKALVKLKKLRRLDLQENYISENTINFTGLMRLENLNLAKNKIHHLQPNLFRNLTSLKTLNLEHNQMETIDENAFVGIADSLEWLSLGENRLMMIPTTALKKLSHLFYLDLRKNHIGTELPEVAFHGYGKTISHLRLQGNNIDHIPILAFEGLHSVTYIDLNNNKLSEVPEVAMDSLLDTLQIIDIHNNPLICNKELCWYSEWVKTKMDQIVNQILVDVTKCREEENQYVIKDFPQEGLTCENSATKISIYTNCLRFIFVVSMNIMYEKILFSLA